MNKTVSTRTIKDIFGIAISNFIKLFSGILVGFLLPKIIGVEDYGYYKTFTLYASYVGVFHFGLIDGIYLKYSGTDYDDLDRKKMSNYTFLIILLEIFISLTFIFLSLIVFTNEARYIFCFVSLFLLFNNVTGYYQYISQATKRFNELSFRNVIQSLLTIIAIGGLFVLNRFSNIEITYKYYTIIYLLITFLLMLWYVITYRNITFNKIDNLFDAIKDLKDFFIQGFPLMVSNLCNTLILTVDRQFVNVFFTNSEYAVYAFAYNMLSLITTATSAISVVIFPIMKKSDEKSLMSKYGSFISLMLVFVSFMMLVYYPLDAFVCWFLPKYVGSLPIFRIVLPGLIISSAITIIMQNYYKYFAKNIEFFVKNIIILVFSIFANFVAYYLFKTTYSISFASIISMILWYVVMDYPFIKRKCKGCIKNFLYLFLILSMFYTVTFIETWYLGMFIQIIIYIILTCIFYFKSFKEMFLKRRIIK